MTAKAVIISSAGLKNVLLDDPSYNNEFHMMFDEIDIKMNKLLAEFISPIVSRICKSDPTVESIQFKEFYSDKSEMFSKFSKEIITSDMVSLIQQISSGHSIYMDDNQAYKMRFISIILENEDLFNKINEIFPPDIDESNIELYANYFQSCYLFSQLTTSFNFTTYVDQVAKNFFLIEPSKLLTLPRSSQYAIISNSHLRIESEDSLYDYIQKILENDQLYDDEYYDDILFYEQIEFSSLSPDKLDEFLSSFDISQITGGLWSKLLPCISHHQSTSARNERYERGTNRIKSVFQYDKNRQNRFHGIIRHLNEQCFGNSVLKGVIDVTLLCKGYSVGNLLNSEPSNVVDLDNINSYTSSVGLDSNWVKFDFKEKSVRPTNYSIRTWNAGPGNSHLKNWVLEGSNTDREGEWKTLDVRKNVNDLDNFSAEQTYEVTTKLEPNESFRYIRLKVNGPNSRNTSILFVSAIEFFGDLL